MEQISSWPKKLMRELLLGLVWGSRNEPKELMREIVLRLIRGAGGPGDTDGRIVAERCFLPKLCASLVKNAEHCKNCSD